jgi:phospholipid/cholesterol/gamma-HCH transport system permease protein
MARNLALQATLVDAARAPGHWLANWWRIALLGASLLAMALTPATYSRACLRALALQLVRGVTPALVGFSVMSALLSFVIIRIVVVTSVSYGLSQYALEMVVRVLVLELIPLTAALYAALRCTIPRAAEIAAPAAAPAAGLGIGLGADFVRLEVLPRVAAGFVGALLLAAISAAVTLVLAYLAVYGASGAGFAAYTRTVGQVFSPAVALVFTLKATAMAAAVALLPIASILIVPARADRLASAEVRGLVRMFFVLLLIEGAGLVGNYY